MSEESILLKKKPRRFLSEDFKVTTWDDLKPYFDQLQERTINSVSELERWLRDASELESVVSEDACWRQIRMTCDTTNPDYQQAFNYFCTDIQPHLQPVIHALNQKLIRCPFTRDLDQERYFTYLRSVKSAIDLFSEKNIPLFSELSILQQQYGQITGAMTIMVKDKEYTLQQAAKFYESSDRDLREEVFRKSADRRMQDREKLDDLYTELVYKRDQVAHNAGFDNYRDYKFEELGRFDYTKEDCFDFHQAVQEHVVPLVGEILKRRKNRLDLEVLRPWDTEAEPEDIKPLEPFKTGEELLSKARTCFDRLRPSFGSYLEIMNRMGRLDLDSRKGKAPGGYNCPLAETGVPFIFMNAAGQMKDVTTMVHEGGHAIQAFLTHDLELGAFKEYPMEIAEVASMSMELFTMDYWDVFFEDPEELKRARLQQLERVVTIFPWIATIDKFQHWVYLHPQHSAEERTRVWEEIQQAFSAGIVDWSGLEAYHSCSWQRQLHLFEVPFYYIEYGIAQLGAIGMWKQFRENKEQALDNYVKALGLGYTVPLKELYKAAGISFDFSPAHVKELIDFVYEEMQKLL